MSLAAEVNARYLGEQYEQLPIPREDPRRSRPSFSRCYEGKGRSWSHVAAEREDALSFEAVSGEELFQN